MAQFTLYENTNRDSKQAYPYFVDVQNDLLDSLNTRLVIPLTPASLLGENMARLSPKAAIRGRDFFLLPHQMTNVPVSALTRPCGSLAHLRNDIVSAIDFLVTGI